MMRLLFTLALATGMTYKLNIHPLDNKIAYIKGIKDVKNLNEKTLDSLRQDFKKYPLLIFKDVQDVSPQTFLDFSKEFDLDADLDALNSPSDYQHQMLQPFDQFPDCKHVAPRGSINLKNYYNIKDINVQPYEPFKTDYIWHSDLLGHDYKLIHIVTGFYIVEQPLIGGDTDFISGERIYDNLNSEEKKACENILVEINRRKFVTGTMTQDYAGVNRLESHSDMDEGTNEVPILFAPDDDKESPRILVLPTFFEKVSGWTVSNSRSWMKNFMTEKVLPFRISIQWQKNDLAIFNNRRWIHSSTPANEYIKNDNGPTRFLMQTFIPTKKPMKAITPNPKNAYACYNTKWINDQEVSIISAHNMIKFSDNIIKNGATAKGAVYEYRTKPNATLF